MRSIFCIPLLLASVYAAPTPKRSNNNPPTPRDLSSAQQAVPRHIGRLAGSRIEQRERVNLSNPDSRSPEEIYTRAWTDLHTPSEDDRRSWSDGEYVGDLLRTDEGGEQGSGQDLEEIQEGGYTDEELAYWAQWQEVVEGEYNQDPSYTSEQGDRVVWWFDEETGGWDYDTYPSTDDTVSTEPIPQIITPDNTVQLRFGAQSSPPTGGWDVDSKGEWYLVNLD
jgi:hypothetical protein